MNETVIKYPETEQKELQICSMMDFGGCCFKKKKCCKKYKKAKPCKSCPKH